ncbi:complement C1q tumor necrosis factor-related protein 6-like [Hemiscyllium ocellatum]|uniref:complement C1q tumor necrosis factor-related protein 6-like n=1 Tax=Hemiscyllium ocellatum TaxID=170820 RepID=UPI002965F7F0|nr:complement C1q tumor necrosis factor-related protein 6-like [Hemiscyllium ocellatum]XP_060709343.1 complement C1q tumor necrosis factor-related protein 6-like [Hemiscyllium ocellatum]
MKLSNPLKLITESKAKLGPTCAWNKKLDVVFDVQRSTMNHVLTPVDPIVYDVVNVNLGQGYSCNTGKFTSPKCGLYFFSYSSLPGRGLETDVALIKNNKAVSVIHSVLPSDSSQLSARTVILNLHQGDQVWVKLVSGNLWSEGGSLSFQGFFLTRSAQ